MRLFVLSCFFALACSQILAQNSAPESREGMGPLGEKSEITAVTVFSDRAQVTRVFEKQLNLGDHRLVFAKMPKSMIEGSLTVRGTGPALLKEIQVTEMVSSQVVNEETKAFYDQKRLLDEKLKRLEDEAKTIEKGKGLLERIAGRLTTVTEKTDPMDLDPTKWSRLLAFYVSENQKMEGQARALQQDIEETKREIRVVASQITMGEDAARQWNQVWVNLHVRESAKVRLELVYMVNHCSWSPSYDIYVSTRDQSGQLNYKGLITQRSGEDWTQADLTLSTADPNLGAQHRDLYPWYLQQREQIAVEAGMEMENTYQELAPMVQTTFDKEVPKEIEVQTTKLVSDGFSVTFGVKGKTTVKSDGSSHSVTVLSQGLLLVFRHSAVPKHSPYAYLKAKFQNTTEYPFLQGDMRVFRDNQYITQTQVKTLVPKEDMWVFLGVDERVKVDYDAMKPVNLNKGNGKKKVKREYKSSFEVTNLKDSPVEITLWDQLPIPMDSSIVVELHEPDPEGAGKAFILTENKYLQWLYTLKPGEKIKVPFRFTVEYPSSYDLAF